MVSWPTYGAGVVIAVASAIAFAYVGHRLGARPVIGDHRVAWATFRVWWFAIAAEFLVSGTISLLAGLGLIDFRVYGSFIYLNLGFLAVGVFGLVYYLLFILTGLRWIFVPVAALYLWYYLSILYLVTAMAPSGIGFGEFRAFLRFENSPDPDVVWVSRALGRWLPIACAVAFLTLVAKTRDPTTRWRAILIATSIAAWAINQEIAALLRGPAPTWYGFANRSVGLLAALLVLLAYFPPRALKERWGLYSIADEATHVTSQPKSPYVPAPPPIRNVP